MDAKPHHISNTFEKLKLNPNNTLIQMPTQNEIKRYKFIIFTAFTLPPPFQSVFFYSRYKEIFQHLNLVFAYSTLNISIKNTPVPKPIEYVSTTVDVAAVVDVVAIDFYFSFSLTFACPASCYLCLRSTIDAHLAKFICFAAIKFG